MKQDINYYHIQIRNVKSGLFRYRSERFAFLNIWRTYFHKVLSTCAYVLIPGRFECVVATNRFGVSNEDKLIKQISETLKIKMSGVWEEQEIQEFCDSVSVQALHTEKDCIYRIFDLHTMPQRKGVSTDYRTYPFSSYQALASVKNTVLAKPVVWQWFGGRMRFTAFHQAYAGWNQPEVGLTG